MQVREASQRKKGGKSIFRSMMQLHEKGRTEGGGADCDSAGARAGTPPVFRGARAAHRGRHADVRRYREELDATRGLRLCADSAWASADADPAAGIPDFSRAVLCGVWRGPLYGGDGGAVPDRPGDVPSGGRSCASAVWWTRRTGSAVAGRAVSVHGELCGGTSDRDAQPVLHCGGSLRTYALEGCGAGVEWLAVGDRRGVGLRCAVAAGAGTVGGGRRSDDAVAGTASAAASAAGRDAGSGCGPCAWCCRWCRGPCGTGRRSMCFSRWLRDTRRIPARRCHSAFSAGFKSWGIEFASTEDVYWNWDSAPIDIADIPTRAFDSEEQYGQTATLLTRYNEDTTATPELDAGFEALAEERRANDPVRYYVALPVARLMDMALRPRTEMMEIDLEWWRWRKHPGQDGVCRAVCAGEPRVPGAGSLRLAAMETKGMGWAAGVVDDRVRYAALRHAADAG